MRPITVLCMLSLDGVMQGPGGAMEDPSNGFDLGGWSRPYGDAIYAQVVQEELQPTTYLLGRTTFEIWEAYWPHNTEFWPAINKETKYVLSATRNETSWNNTIFLPNIEAIIELKKSNGGPLHVWGSSKLVQLLMEHNMVDEFRLKIHPIVLGKGKKLFHSGKVPAVYTLVNSITTTTGVIILHYKKQ